MFEHLANGLNLNGIGWVRVSVALILREWFAGRAKIIRATRGDPEPPTWRSSLPAILGLVLRRGKAPETLPEG